MNQGERKLQYPLDILRAAASLRAIKPDAEEIESQFIAELSGMNPRSVLHATRYLLDRVHEAGIDPTSHLSFVAMLPTMLQPRAREWLAESPQRRVLLSEQNICLAGIHALAKSNPSADTEDTLAVARIASASLAVADTCGAPKGSLLLSLSRAAQFSPSEGWVHAVAEAEALVPLLCASHRKINFNRICETATGVDLEAAWSMTALFATLGGRNQPNTLLDWPTTEEPTWNYDEATRRAGRALWTQTLAECIDRSIEDLATPGYSFTAISDRPIIDDGEETIVVWPRAFSEKAFPFGLFALVERVCLAQGLERAQVRAECGMVMEERAAQLLDVEGQRYAHLQDVLTEEQQKMRFTTSRYQPKRCDWLLVERKRLVALEVRHRPISLKGSATGTAGDLERDFEEAIVRKLVQCDHALANASEAGLLRGRTPLAVVVNSCPLPVTPLLMDHVAKELTPERAPFLARNPYDFAILDLSELRQVLRGARKKGLSLGEVLHRWRTDKHLRDVSFYNWATQRMPSATGRPGSEWIDSVASRVLGLQV